MGSASRVVLHVAGAGSTKPERRELLRGDTNVSCFPKAVKSTKPYTKYTTTICFCHNARQRIQTIGLVTKLPRSSLCLVCSSRTQHQGFPKRRCSKRMQKRWSAPERCCGHWVTQRWLNVELLDFLSPGSSGSQATLECTCDCSR